MCDSTNDLPPDIAEAVDELEEQAEDPCYIHDHITRVITNLEIDEDWFSDYRHTDDADFTITGIVKLFLY